MMKRLILLALLMAAALSASVILEQNFDDTIVFKQGPLANGAARTPLGGSWKVYSDGAEDFTIVTEPAASAPHALKVLRQTHIGGTALRFHPAEGYDFSFECKIWLGTGHGVELDFLQDGNKRPFAGVLLEADRAPAAYNAAMGWQPDASMPPLPTDQWFTFLLEFDCAKKCYRLLVVSDGMSHRGTTEYPVVIDGACDEMRFVNIMPRGRQSFIDDVVIMQADAPALSGRTLLNGRATAADKALAAVVAGEVGGKCAVKAGTSLRIDFTPEADLGALILTAADGALPKVTVKAVNLLGHQVDLGAGLQCDANGFLPLPTTQKVSTLSLEFAAATTLTALRLYSPLSAGQGELDRQFAAKLDAEYRLPVYDLQYAGHERAQFTFVNHTDDTIPVVVALQERASGRDCGSREVQVPPGRSDIYYDLKEMPNGEYLTRVIDNSEPDAPKHGTLERLLRLRTSPPCAATPWKEVTGQKIFFPDGFYLTAYENVDFIPGTAERHLVLKGKPGEDDPFIYYGDDIFVDKDGRVRVNYHTLNRQWRLDSIRRFSAVALDESLDKWESSEGTVAIPPQKRPFDSKLPPAARPDWQRKPAPDGKITYHFYDAEKDGPVKLSQINLDMVSPSAPGINGYQENDWKILKPAACTIWPVWYKAPGEAVILSRTPLVDTFPGGYALEPPNSGSDLGFGQWLSDDGKTLYMGHGRHLMRYMPYVARYDNLHDRARIVAVWRTTDGLHWEQNYVAPPSDNKPLADQSYGGKHFNVPDGAGLRIAFFNRYNAYTQQISWELIYSWDSFRWTRYQDKPPFMPNGPLGDWFHGSGYAGNNAVEKDGKFYHLMAWVNDHYHFQSEIVHENILLAKDLTEDYLKKRFMPRHLDEWPFFQEYFDGSWEKLAKHTHDATSGIGVMVYRKDGYFAATAGDATARMVTTPFAAKGAFKANVVVAEDGFMKARLLQNDKPLEGFEKQVGPCDDVALPLFDRLPDGDFQVEITMKNARLYTLQF